MTDLSWHDHVTGTVYQCKETWLGKVRAHLVGHLREAIGGTKNLRVAADNVAHFWRKEYYELIFPLRIGMVYRNEWLETQTLFPPQPEIVLADNGQRLRQNFLDEDGWPPILPDAALGKDGWLQVDRLLIEAASCNVILRGVLPAVQEELIHAVRLAALTYPFIHALDLQAFDAAQRVAAIAQLFQAQMQETDLHTSLLLILREISGSLPITAADCQVGLVAVAIQRVKQYVFESSGRNEIRGGSTLLDRVTEDLAQEVSEQIGPEVVLRAAGSSLLYLAPIDAAFAQRAAAHRQYIFGETCAAFPAAAAVATSLEAVLTHYSDALRTVQMAMGADRAHARQPMYVTYPFETRCDFCLVRPAQQRLYFDDGDPVSICKVCETKRAVGRPERKGKVQQILRDLHLLDGVAHGEQPLKRLSIQGNAAGEWLANDLGGLIPEKARRRLLGVVYADGNNFGTFAHSINTIALSLQWSARVTHTTRAATALALGKATQWIAQQRGWSLGKEPLFNKVPFQVLALGGDDVSLFAWAPVAIYFAAEFTRLTDQELAHVNPASSLHFSAGVLLTDEKTPVLKSVDFTEDELLKWAKKANKAQKLTSGNIATLYAETAENVPSNLARYRASTYLLGEKGSFQLCTTMRPYIATELSALLRIAAYIHKAGNLGQLERLVGAFYGARQSAYSGMLHYAYQKGRQYGQPNGGWIAKLETQIIKEMEQDNAPPQSALLIDYRAPQSSPKANHPPFGLGAARANPESDGSVRFSQLSDLLELTKILT